MTTITIDDKKLEAAPGVSVLEAALAAGIDVPRLCFHPELSVSGGCRLCLVEVEGRRDPRPSCGLACEDGMTVHTESERLAELRRDVLDLFLSDHPASCLAGASEHDCDLRRYAARYGLSDTTHERELSRTLYQDDNPFFIRDHEACFLCSRCVRVCDEVVGANAIDLAGRGSASHVATPFDGPMISSSCVFCGSCVQVCPTHALVAKTRIGRGPSSELERKRTVCGYCGVGCKIEYSLRDGAIVEARGYTEAPVNGELLCVKGRFGWDYATSPERLTRPLVRRGDGFTQVTWEAAFDIIASRLATVVRGHGPDAVALLASARCTNEENYLFQKLARVAIGTNNVDHCARLCHASSVTGLGMAFGSAAMTNPIREIRGADCILITGSNTAESHPVIGYEVVRAVKRGATLVIIDPRRVPLVDHATLHLRPKPGADIYVFLAMAHVIVREGWLDAAFVQDRTEGYEAFLASVQHMSPAAAALASGVPTEQIERAARLYALGQRNGAEQNGRGLTYTQHPTPNTHPRGRSTILYAMGITQRSNGTELVLALANLAMLCGQIGRPSTGVNPLRGQSNVQGACDVGALPNVLPGYQPLEDDVARQAVARAWRLQDLPATPGLTVVEMMQAAADGRVRAMYIMGENPMLSDPNIGHVEAGLRKLDFLVVQDIFLSETAQLADMVLPAASSLEKHGTMTNTERRVQLLEPVLSPPGQALPDWKILSALADWLDVRLDRRRTPYYWAYASSAAIMEELASVTPIYGGVRHTRLGEEGLVWPCPAEDHPGTPILHEKQFPRGRGKLHAVAPRAPAEQPDEEFPFVLNTGRILYQYHTGTMTRRSEGLVWREPRDYAEVNDADAARLGIQDGDEVSIRSRRGEVRTVARLGDRAPPGTIFLAFHWKEAPANLLTQDYALDPLAKIPEYKMTAVRLERAAEGTAAS